MPTIGERRALIFLASVAALGVGARGWKELHSDSTPGRAGDRAALARQIEAVDSAIVAGGDRRRGTSASRGKRAAVAVGQGNAPVSAGSRAAPPAAPPLVERDVRALYRLRREHHDSLVKLDSGTFGRSRRSRRARAAPARSPAESRSRDAAPRGRSGKPVPPAGRLDLDLATVDQLETLPWVGRALAASIVADRAARGPFGSLAGLQRVPGIGPGIAARLQPYVTFSLVPRLGSTVERWPRAPARRRRRG